MPQITLIEGITMALAHEMARDPSVVVLGEDVGINGGVFRATVGLQQKFGAERVIDTPLDEQRAAAPSERCRSASLIWRRPWMTTNADTYGSSLLDLLGVDNVFADSNERYPQVALEEIAERRPDLVLLPDEPYAFGERHIQEVAAAVADADVRLVDGRDLFWWGIRTPAAAARLRDALRRQ